MYLIQNYKVTYVWQHFLREICAAGDTIFRRQLCQQHLDAFLLSPSQWVDVNGNFFHYGIMYIDSP